MLRATEPSDFLKHLEDLETSAQEAYIATGYERQHRGGSELAKFCFINPLLNIERILTTRPREVQAAGGGLSCTTVDHSGKNCTKSNLFVRGLTIARGDTRVVLAFSEGDTLVVSGGGHLPCVGSVNLSAFHNGEDRGGCGPAGVGAKGEKKIIGALVSGCTAFLYVCTDRDVGQICTCQECPLTATRH